MEVRSEISQVRYDKFQAPVIPRTRIQVWFIRICSSILLWTCLVQLVAVGELWHPKFFTDISNRISWPTRLPGHDEVVVPSPPLQPRVAPRNYTSNGFLKVSCNGGLNQMRAAICDMVTVARFLNLTLVVPELDKTSFWADPSNFEDIFDVRHFIDSLRDEVRIVKRLPKKYNQKYGYKPFEMPPVSWSNEKYYLQQDTLRRMHPIYSPLYLPRLRILIYGVDSIMQILPIFSKYKVLHFNRTDTRLANNGIPLDLQKLRCRVNFQGLKFTPEIETLGYKLVRMLQEKGPFVALHLRYEMDMLAFSGCTSGCSMEEADELKLLRHAYPWWREKEIVSEERRLKGLCPLTPEEAALVLQALGFNKDMQIYIAAGDIYGGEKRLAALRAAFPRIVKKEMLLDPTELQQFQNHSSQMAALDFMVSTASDTFIPTYDGNMAKVVEGHRRYLGFKRSVLLDRRRLVELIDLHQNGTLSWSEFTDAVWLAHDKRMGQPMHRRVIADKPKEEDYFYANPQECLCEGMKCDSLPGRGNSSQVQ